MFASMARLYNTLSSGHGAWQADILPGVLQGPKGAILVQLKRGKFRYLQIIDCQWCCRTGAVNYKGQPRAV